MTSKELLDSFIPLNKSEIYYKNIFLSHNDILDNKPYLDRTTFIKIIHDNPELGEYAPEGALVLPDKFDDDSYFKSENDLNVLVTRHNRYTPLFYNKHTFYEIICVIKGSCEHIVNEKNFTLSEGDICFLPPGMTHAIAVFDDESIILNILVRRSFFNGMLYELLTQDNAITEFFTTSKENAQYLTFHSKEKGELSHLIREMYIEANIETVYNKQVIECQLIMLFSKLLRYYSETMEQNIRSKYKDNQTYEFILYIQQHIDTINLKTMANDFGYTMQHLSKKFKKVSGFNFNEVVKNLKLQKAKHYLTKSNYKIADISARLGYKNEESFIRMFKSSHGVTPATYRQHNVSNVLESLV